MLFFALLNLTFFKLVKNGEFADSVYCKSKNIVSKPFETIAKTNTTKHISVGRSFKKTKLWAAESVYILAFLLNRTGELSLLEIKSNILVNHPPG